MVVNCYNLFTRTMYAVSSPPPPPSLSLSPPLSPRLGLPRSYPKTTIGDDGNPNPIGSGGGPQQAPMTIAGGQVPRAQVLRASDPRPPQTGGVQVLPTNHSVKVSGMCRREKGREGAKARVTEREREKERESSLMFTYTCTCWGKFNTTFLQ